MLWMDWTPVWQGESRMCPDNCVIFPLHRQQSSMNIVTACVWKVYLCASSHLGICSSKNLFTLNDPTLKNAIIHTKKAEWPTSPISEIWIQGKEGCHPNDWGLVEWGGPDDWGPGEWEASSSMNFDLRPSVVVVANRSLFEVMTHIHTHWQSLFQLIPIWSTLVMIMMMWPFLEDRMQHSVGSGARSCEDSEVVVGELSSCCNIGHDHHHPLSNGNHIEFNSNT